MHAQQIWTQLFDAFFQEKPLFAKNKHFPTFPLFLFASNRWTWNVFTVNFNNINVYALKIEPNLVEWSTKLQVINNICMWF